MKTTQTNDILIDRRMKNDIFYRNGIVIKSATATAT